jgi:exopolysaccharide production protein ExoZ
MEGLRGIAVSMVFFVHYSAFDAYLPPGIVRATSAFLASAGNAGVDLFFVLSGYLIYGALIRKRVGYLVFLRRRVQRIYPTFLAVFVVYLVLSVAAPERSRIAGGPLDVLFLLASNVLLLPGIFPITPIITVAWSLSYEFFFYLSMPLFVLATGMRAWTSRARLALAATLWGALSVLCLWHEMRHPRLLLFLAGIVLYELSASASVRRLSRVGEAAALVANVAVLALLYWPDVAAPALAAFGAREGLLVAFKAVALSGTFLLLCLYSFEFAGFLRRVFSWTPLRWLGNISYSYYLLHGLTLNIVALAVRRLIPPTGSQSEVFFVALPLAFGATWCTATALFALVERPFSLVVAKPR